MFLAWQSVFLSYFWSVQFVKFLRRLWDVSHGLNGPSLLMRMAQRTISIGPDIAGKLHYFLLLEGLDWWMVGSLDLQSGFNFTSTAPLTCSSQITHLLHSALVSVWPFLQYPEGLWDVLSGLQFANLHVFNILMNRLPFTTLVASACAGVVEPATARSTWCHFWPKKPDVVGRTHAVGASLDFL